ncbi:MAG: imidazole glycerol phosphate synthase subunit HisF [Planctomycetota bacterium]|jgi:cyclase
MIQTTKNIRIITRLDIKGPNLVKGIQFDGYRALGKAEDYAYLYYSETADELIFYDTVASLYQRNNLLEFVSAVSQHIFVPLTVAGGIRTVEDVRKVLRAGADKVAINTAAVGNPRLLSDAAKAFGTQCIVAGIETKKRDDGTYEAWVDYGRQPTGIDAIEWAKQVVELGAGEILLTSIDFEGTGRGFDIELTKRISESVPVPVIASGGAGSRQDVLNVIKEGDADAVAIASIFHYCYASPVKQMFSASDTGGLRMGKQIDEGNVEFLNLRYGGLGEKRFNPISIPKIKNYLNTHGISCRNQLNIPEL